MKATYEPELVDDLEVPNNIPGEQREGDVPDDAHGNNAQEEAPGSDIQEEEQRDEDIVINERQRQVETSHQHQPPYRTSRGRVIKCPKRFAEFVKL